VTSPSQFNEGLRVAESNERMATPHDEDRLRRRISELEAEVGRLQAALGEPGETRAGPVVRTRTLTGPEASTARQYKQVAEILDLSADAIVSADREGKVLRFNRGAERIFGYRSSEIIGCPLDILIPARFRRQHRQHLANFTRSPDASRLMNQRGEIYGLRRDGSEFPAEASIVRLDNGRQPIFSIILRDITERKSAEAALRESEAQLRQAHKLSRIGTFVWDEITDRCAYCSDDLAEILGFTPESLPESRQSQNWMRERIHPDDRDKYDSVVDGYLEAGTPYEMEFRFHKGDGQLIHLREIGEPEMDGGGRVFRTFGTIQDVTDMRRAQEALRRSEEQFRSLIEGSIQGVLIHRDFQPVFVNRAFAEIFGYAAPEEIFTLQSAMALVAADERQRLSAFAEARAENRNPPERYEFRGLRKDGSQIWLENRARVVRWDGEIAIMAVLADVTERRQAEEALRHAQRMEAVGKLTGGVAHDFNNLLAVIMGNAELARDRLGQDDPTIRAIADAAQRGADLTRRLLAFSRQQPLRPRAVDLTTLVRDIAVMLSRTLGETVAVEPRLANDTWPARVDRGELENAILNLAINARDAMRGGGILTIDTGNVTLDREAAARFQDAKPGDYIRIALGDTGCGMAPNIVNHAFEPFFTTKPFGEGSGLGLSMVYGFATQSGGFASIRSQVGEGTTVSVYLPRANCSERSACGGAAARQPNSEGASVMVIEDDPDVRKLTVTLLKSMGYSVLAAEDAETALPLLLGNVHIDLLLSDVVLPGDLTGPAIAEQALARRPRLRVLFMSGYAKDVIRGERDGKEKAIDADLLAKPFTRAQLAGMVKSALGAEDA
jgi:PAS domain S-box-containing protein